jgi:hypothetical protein
MNMPKDTINNDIKLYYILLGLLLSIHTLLGRTSTNLYLLYGFSMAEDLLLYSQMDLSPGSLPLAVEFSLEYFLESEELNQNSILNTLCSTSANWLYNSRLNNQRKKKKITSSQALTTVFCKTIIIISIENSIEIEKLLHTRLENTTISTDWKTFSVQQLYVFTEVFIYVLLLNNNCKKDLQCAIKDFYSMQTPSRQAKLRILTDVLL